MTKDEIVKSLRCCGNHGDCAHCPLHNDMSVEKCYASSREGADLIESLQAELLQKTQELAEAQRRERAALAEVERLKTACHNCLGLSLMAAHGYGEIKHLPEPPERKGD